MVKRRHHVDVTGRLFLRQRTAPAVRSLESSTAWSVTHHTPGCCFAMVALCELSSVLDHRAHSTKLKLRAQANRSCGIGE